MNKKLAVGALGVLLLTGGYYASAHGLPGFRATTTTYKPGTPPGMDYPGSPYEIGSTTQTTQQTPRTTATTNDAQASPVPSSGTASHTPTYPMTTIQLGGYDITLPVPQGWTLQVQQHNQATVSDSAVWHDGRSGGEAIILGSGNPAQLIPENFSGTLSSLVRHGWKEDTQTGTVISPIYHYHGKLAKMGVFQLGAMGGYPMVSMVVEVFQPSSDPGLINAVFHDIEWKNVWPN